MFKILDTSREVSENKELQQLVSQVKNNPKYGFVKFIEDQNVWNQFSDTLNDLKSSHWQQLAVIGIGGSTQGLKSLVTATHPEALDSRRLIIFDNLCGSSILKNLEAIADPHETLWLFASKSGTTNETLILINAIENYYQAKNISPFNKSVLISGSKDSPLAQWIIAKDGHIVDYPEGIEGRFSVLSTPALLPYGLLGYDAEAVRSGALWLLNQDSLVAQLVEYFRGTFKEQRWVTHFWFYHANLVEFGKWLEQLWGESLGKGEDSSEKRVSTPVFNLGSNDQHSVLQQMIEGYPDKAHLVTYYLKETGPKISSPIDEAFELYKGYSTDHLLNLFAQSTHKSLSRKNPSMLFEISEVSDQTMGALFMLYQLLVTSIGESMGIEVYGQPGVEESKTIFRGLLTS